MEHTHQSHIDGIRKMITDFGDEQSLEDAQTLLNKWFSTAEQRAEFLILAEWAIWNSGRGKLSQLRDVNFKLFRLAPSSSTAGCDSSDVVPDAVKLETEELYREAEDRYLLKLEEMEGYVTWHIGSYEQFCSERGYYEELSRSAVGRALLKAGETKAKKPD